MPWNRPHPAWGNFLHTLSWRSGMLPGSVETRTLLTIWCLNHQVAFLIFNSTGHRNEMLSLKHLISGTKQQNLINVTQDEWLLVTQLFRLFLINYSMLASWCFIKKKKRKNNNNNPTVWGSNLCVSPLLIGQLESQDAVCLFRKRDLMPGAKRRQSEQRTSGSPPTLWQVVLWVTSCRDVKTVVGICRWWKMSQQSLCSHFPV